METRRNASPENDTGGTQLSRKASLGCLIGLLLGIGLLGLGCGQDGSQPATPAAPAITGTSSGEALLSVRLSSSGTTSDSPTGILGRLHVRDSGIAQLFLTFDSIRLYPALDSLPCDRPRPDSLPPGPRPDSLPPGPRRHPRPCCPPDSAGFVEILTSPVTVDAMQLADTLGSLLTSASVPAGNYSHLALRIPAASALTDSGATVIVVPACPDSMLRVLSRFAVTDGQAVELQIRVDLDRSVREVPPGSGHFILMPVFSGELHSAGGGHPGGPGGHGPGGRHRP
jgi:hypothetical protein